VNTLDGATYPGESLFSKRISSAREVYQICFCEMRKLPTKNGINSALDTTQRLARLRR
jgi:hypothetical protein